MIRLDRRMHSMKVLVAMAIAVSSPGVTAEAASITINADVAATNITDGSSIPVDGWVYGAQAFGNPANPEQVTATYVNKVKIYLFYQQTRPTATHPGSLPYQLDADLANFQNGSSTSASYSGSVTANMPDRDTTPVTPTCWFLRSEALYDTAQAPNAPVAWCEKTVSLVWTSGGGS